MQRTLLENRPAKWLALGLFLALAAATAGAALGRLDRFATAADELQNQPFEVADALLRAHNHVHALRDRLREVVLGADADGANEIMSRTSADDTDLVAALDLVVQHQRRDHDTVHTLVAAITRWYDVRAQVADLVAAGRWHDAAFLLNNDGERSHHMLRIALGKALEAERRHAANLRSDAEQEQRTARYLAMTLAVLVGGAMACTGAGLMVWLSTHRPMQRLRHCMLALAAGNTGIVIPYTQKAGAIGEFARAIHRFRESVLERDAVTRALRRSKAQMRQAVDEARHAEAAKNRFLAAASHDLRQPLQALRLYLDTLERRLDDRLDRRILTGALAALGAGEELLGNYLDVSVLQSGIVKPEPAEVAIAPLLDDVLQELRGAAADKGLSLAHVPCGAVVRTDPVLLRRMVRNLVANAVRYTEQGGVVVGCRRRGRWLRIQVWDSGIGIAADQLRAVFEDFYQIGNPERDRANGLGLGLSVVDRAARLLGHEVTVASTPGAGSVFTIAVPLVGNSKRRSDALAA